VCIFSGIIQGIVVMKNNLQNSISTNQLCREYDWYSKTFPDLIQTTCDSFFEKNFELRLISLSKNINCLIDKESCFVTKIRIDKEYDMFFRLTEKAINIILTKILGTSKRKFDINKMSELESRILTVFNDFMFEHLKSAINPPNPAELKRRNFDVVNLTFSVQEIDDVKHYVGKFIVTMPQSLIGAQAINPSRQAISEDTFPQCPTRVKIIVGKTKFSVYDLKNLEKDDLVIFDNSNLRVFKLNINGQILDLNINPNMDLLIPDIDNGGDEMEDNHQNIWDSITVDMYAEFDAVKITLGELKDIEAGMVMDITSLYENKVTLKVEDKSIATGSLVIVNDRYGVKVDKIIAGQDEDNNFSQAAIPNSRPETPPVQEENFAEDSQETPEEIPQEQQASSDNEEEFDYSDFELDDDNI